jgi:arabinogalactan endo-1,4-beta-galactosidase
VSWSSAREWITGPGEYVLSGVTSSGLSARALVTVTARTWVVDGSFETATNPAWTVTGTGGSIGASSDASDGARALSLWAAEAYSGAVTQELGALPAGSYRLSATSQGGDGGASGLSLFLETDAAEASAELERAGWQVFRTATTTALELSEPTPVRVGVRWNIGAGGWGTVDAFTLTRVVEQAVDTTALTALLEETEAIDTSGYTDASVAALTEAQNIARIVLGADSPSAEHVADATARLADARDALEPRPTSTPTPTTSPSPAPTPTETSSPTPGPTATTSPAPAGTPVAPGEDQLTDATKGIITAPGSAVAGSVITIGVGTGFAGSTVNAWMFSTPTSLGTHTVRADGTITLTLPTTAASGIHRIVVTDSAGDVIGWTEIRVAGLATTGGSDPVALAWIAAILVMAGAVVAGLRRRSHGARSGRAAS